MAGGEPPAACGSDAVPEPVKTESVQTEPEPVEERPDPLESDLEALEAPDPPRQEAPRQSTSEHAEWETRERHTPRYVPRRRMLRGHVQRPGEDPLLSPKERQALAALAVVALGLIVFSGGTLFGLWWVLGGAMLDAFGI